MSSSSDIVTVDVGGQKIRTTRMTLMSDPNSALARMFDPDSSIPPSKLVEGAYFIDADPDVFKVVLHFLRYKSLVIPTSVPVQAVKDQAMFFGLEGMVAEMIEEMSKPGDEKPNSRIKIKASWQTFETSRKILTRKINGRMCKLGRMVEDGVSEIFLDMPPEDFSAILKLLQSMGGDQYNFTPSFGLLESLKTIENSFQSLTGVICVEIRKNDCFFRFEEY